MAYLMPLPDAVPEDLPSRDNLVIKSFDVALHQMLSKTFRERCLTKAQIKEFLCAPEHCADRNSLIKLVLDQEPFLTQHFSKEELEKLSLLWIAVLGYYYQSAELLVRLGANVNELCGMGGDIRSIGHQEMLETDFDENSTILHVLLQNDPSLENELLIRLVTDHGADLQARNIYGQTVLHVAIQEDRVQLTEMFLKKGVDLNTADDDKTLLLQAASTSKADQLVPLLIKYGADASVKNKEDGRNALHCLAFTLDVEHPADVAKILIEKGISIEDREYDLQSQPIHLAAFRADNELVKFFLENGANVNTLRDDNESPLYLAARWNNDPAVLETLLRHGANIDQKTTKGRTALHAAASAVHFQYRKWTKISILLSAGADVLVEDFQGNTPFALMNHENTENPGIRPMIKLLALKKVCLQLNELRDEGIIKRYPKLLKYYQNCIEEVKRMKSTRFIENCTFLSLLTKSHCRIADLMRNPEFETKFILFDCLGIFPTYVEDLIRAFKRAEYHFHSMLKHEEIINEALYSVLPNLLLVRMVLRYISYDCCYYRM